MQRESRDIRGDRDLHPMFGDVRSGGTAWILGFTIQRKTLYVCRGLGINLVAQGTNLPIPAFND